MLYYVTENNITEISRSLVIAIAVIALAVVVGFYVLRGLGLYKLAKRHNVKLAILAWFPFTWIYVAALLLGEVAMFGRRFAKFALTVFIVFSIAEVFYLTINLLEYIPVIGFYLQKGDVYIAYRSSLLNFCNYRIGTSVGYIGCDGILTPYSQNFVKALQVFVYVASAFNIVSLVLQVTVYSNFFRSFLPNHYFIATIFSIFGFFGPFAFAVRNNNRVNYAEYMRARYAAFYGAGRGFGEGNGGASQQDPGDPFEQPSNENKEKSEEGENDDPFGEFSDKK
ncbi:MAG: hypothetical protein SPL13_01330 [Clostridia bacterium]|nr:hypothetical protein [Clostridia bacterium]